MEKLGSLHGIFLRTGCMCNPGACAQALGLTPAGAAAAAAALLLLLLLLRMLLLVCLLLLHGKRSPAFMHGPCGLGWAGLGGAAPC